MTIMFALLISYLIGSISFSFVIAKVFKKIDIRQHGSGNAGATNTLRVLGVGPAILVLGLDIVKGIVAVLIGKGLVGPEWLPFMSGLAAIIGHNWPVFHGFRGGKGVATTIGVFATLVFLPALYAGIIAILLIVITRYVSFGSLFFIAMTPVSILFLSSYPTSYSFYAAIIALLSIWQHRSNIQKLVAGTENKIGQKAM